MIFPNQKDLVATRPIYRLQGNVYKAGTFEWDSTTTYPAPDILLETEDFTISNNSILIDGDDGLPIGHAISKIAQLSLVARSWKYKPSDFAGAQILLNAYFSGADGYHAVLNELFFVTGVVENNGAIQLTAQDALTIFDNPYKMSFDYDYTPSLSEIYEDVIAQTLPKLYAISGIITNDYQILNGALVAYGRFEGYTCRKVLEFIAQVACGNVYAAPIAKGYVEIRTLSTAQPFNSLNQWLEIEDEAETITVTGLRAIRTKDTRGRDVDPPIEIKSTPFSDEYPITINNPLIVGYEEFYFSHMLPTLSALQFHKFKGKHIGYPLAEYGDYAVVTHRGGTFNTFLTNITWNISGATEFECNIATAAENAADYDNSNGTIEKIEDEEPATQVFDKPTTFNSTAAFNGAASFADAATFNGSVKLNGGTELHGEIEVYGDNPHIDFHHANSTDDYTSRIIEDAAGAIDILAPNGLKLNGSNLKYDDTAIKNRLTAIEKKENVTLTANTARISNASYTAKYFPLLGMVFVRIYGKIHATLNAGYDYDLFTINSRAPDSNAALSVKCGKNAMAVAKTSSSGSAIQIRPLESGINGYDVYITGFWFV